MTGLDDLVSPRSLLVAFGVVTVVAVVVAASTSTTAFGLYNAAWDGASDLRSSAEDAGATSTVARNTTAYAAQSPNETVAVVLSPDRAYGAGERQRIETFVRNGGTLVVAEDYGTHSNDLLGAVGARARLDGRSLRDERYNYRSPAMPVARNVTDHALVDGVGRLTLNHGTAVVPNGATVLARSSAYAYLDADGDGDLDDAESVEAYPVATVEQVGRGEVVVVGDPSLFINAMLDRSGNRQFAANLFGSHAHVLLDYSHAARLPPLAVALLTVRQSPLLQFLAGTLCTFVVVLVARTDALAALRARLSGSGPGTMSDYGPETAPVEVDDDDLAAYLRDRHPDWDDERVRRVVSARRTDDPPE